MPAPMIAIRFMNNSDLITVVSSRAVAGWVFAAAAMAALWALHLKMRNAAVVDAGWTALVAALAVWDAIAGDGLPARRLLIAAMMAAWGARLTWYLVVDRILAGREDARYAALRQARGGGANAWFFWFFQAQAIAAVLFSAPAFFSTMNRAPEFSLAEKGAVVLWIVAVCGEAIADAQLSRFKRDPANRGRTCQAGLWRYSRHPNYFFEWLTWMAFAAFAAAAPWGWLAFGCPAAMLFLLFKVTGIPATEAQAVRSRGDEYRAYQRSVSVFVPWFRRSPRTTTP
jgi:steroid 5-alpha reductase family enzyme